MATFIIYFLIITENNFVIQKRGMLKKKSPQQVPKYARPLVQFPEELLREQKVLEMRMS